MLRVPPHLLHCPTLLLLLLLALGAWLALLGCCCSWLRLWAEAARQNDKHFVTSCCIQL
jgi:hypothetical protein